MAVKTLLATGFPTTPATELTRQTSGAISSGDIAAWSIALLVVLGVFFLCVWGLRKFSDFTAVSGDKMRMIGGLSLGLREKVVLLEVGKKQLILGVTPGRIETLLVLEGEDRLKREKPEAMTASGFSQRLAQASRVNSDDA